MADLVIGGAWQALDGNGDPLPGAKAYFYDTGTTNARTTYQDSGAVTPHADPVVADANGFFPEVFVTGGTAVKCVLKTSADVTVTTQDPCLRINVSSSASAVSFTPTAEIAETNVQDAIENVRANLPTAGVSTYMKGLLDDADEATFKASVNLEIGTDVQAYDAELAALAGLTSAANKVPMFSGSGTATLLDFKDEDNMASDSATAVPSQQSVKAYVDTNTGGKTLLGTLTTTSGASQALTSLDLTGYKQIEAWFHGVSASSSYTLSFPESGCNTGVGFGASSLVYGVVIIDLTDGAGISSVNPLGAAPVTGGSNLVQFHSTISTATTTLTAATSAGAFDAGSITVYGVK